MVKTPDNVAAREVERLRSWNNDLDEQISVLMAKELENAENIGLLLTVANWVEEPTAPVEQIPGEPTTEPVIEPPVVAEPIITTGGDLVKDKVTKLEKAELVSLQPELPIFEEEVLTNE